MIGVNCEGQYNLSIVIDYNYWKVKYFQLIMKRNYEHLIQNLFFTIADLKQVNNGALVLVLCQEMSHIPVDRSMAEFFIVYNNA